MIKKLRKWARRLLKRKYKYQFVTDIPELSKPRVLYIIENYGFLWQVVMICPCGCKKLLQMNLMKEYNPYWRFEIDKKNRISLHPSIQRVVGCKSHFFLRKGNIQWV